MILEYHRPDHLEEALGLLARSTPPTKPMGGGSHLNRKGEGDFAVVDLQNLGLDQIELQEDRLVIGANCRIHTLVDAEIIPPALKMAAQIDVNYNLSQVATLAGTLVSADGRSALACVLTALDARLVWLPDEVEISLADWYTQRSEGAAAKSGTLIVRVEVPAQARCAYQQVARTPKDWPLVSAVAAAWPDGRIRLAVGGFGPAPVIAFDGTNTGADPYVLAARQKMLNAGDEWASADYRQEMAAVLAQRCVREVVGR